jgi:hypothetical protein
VAPGDLARRRLAPPREPASRRSGRSEGGSDLPRPPRRELRTVDGHRSSVPALAPPPGFPPKVHLRPARSQGPGPRSSRPAGRLPSLGFPCHHACRGASSLLGAEGGIRGGAERYVQEPVRWDGVSFPRCAMRRAASAGRVPRHRRGTRPRRVLDPVRARGRVDGAIPPGGPSRSESALPARTGAAGAAVSVRPGGALGSLTGRRRASSSPRGGSPAVLPIMMTCERAKTKEAAPVGSRKASASSSSPSWSWLGPRGTGSWRWSGSIELSGADGLRNP